MLNLSKLRITELQILNKKSLNDLNDWHDLLSPLLVLTPRSTSKMALNAFNSFTKEQLSIAQDNKNYSFETNKKDNVKNNSNILDNMKGNYVSSPKENILSKADVFLVKSTLST